MKEDDKVKIKYVDPIEYNFSGEGSPIEFFTLKQMKEIGIKDRIGAIIEHCRQKNKDNKEQKTDLIDEMLRDGTIKLSTYIQMREAILNPDADYEINFIDK